MSKPLLREMVPATIWARPDYEKVDYEIEGDPIYIAVDRSDITEVSLHAIKEGADTEETGLYMTLEGAAQLISMLANVLAGALEQDDDG